jgi:hypothetical protein
MSDPSFYVDATAAAALTARVPAANVDSGMNAGGSNTPGIGIGEGVAALSGDEAQFTLLDQYGAARTPQDSQHLGGEGITTNAEYPSSGGVEGKGTTPIEFGTNDAAGVGDVTSTGDATLTSLATGWVATP